MIKLILSAFAMSLMVFSMGIKAQTEAIDDFLGLETEILPDLQGPNRFTKADLYESKDWKVSPDDAVIDLKEPKKDQNHSLISWSELDPEEWLSINTWMLERAVKDRTPDWKIRLRSALHKELVGKVLHCKGSCFVYRGSEKTNVHHLSKINEGDEFHTDKNSIAWIFLMDGSLVRLSPDTSLSFHEINLSLKEAFILARLNFGHIFWNARSNQEHVVDYLPETDSVSLPLMVREANQEFFERELFRNKTDEQRLLDIINLDDPAVENQFGKLNQLISENNVKFKMGTRVMLITPNMNIVAKNMSFDLVYLFSGKSYFKNRTSSEEKISLSLRGYASTEDYDIADDKWYEVESDGRNYKKLENAPSILKILELITKRIKTVELAREIWIKKFTLPIFNNISSPEILASAHGYSLWGNEIETRYKYLQEYTRRVETTNLRSINNLLAKDEPKTEYPRDELSEKLYQVSLNDYLLGLKSRYDKKKIKVKEMNDLQYYVWILRNGKY